MDGIPIFSFPLNINQSNPNVSSLLIGIQTSGGTQYSQNIIYVPETNYPPPVTTAVSPPYYTYNDLISIYYFIYNIQPFITMVNTALAAAVTASGIGVPAPYFIYTPTTQLISLIVTAAFLATGAKIYLNDILEPYFNSFVYYYQYNSTTENLFFFDLSVLPYGSPSGGPYQFTEEYNSLALWFDIRKIVITSGSIPVVPEANPVYSNASYGQNGTANYLPIMTDFAVSYNNIDDVNTILTYNPQAQYRLIDLKSNSPLTRIQLTFYWLSKNGSLYPLYTSPNQVVEVKIGFFKKYLFRLKDE